MPLSRRDLIRSGFVVGGAVALGGRPGSAWALPTVINPVGTTLATTYAKGAAGAGGYVPVVTAAGEPHIVRSDLGTPPQLGREGRRTAVVSFAHLTDVHLIDAQSPMRVEYVDRFEDKYSSGDPVIGLLTSSYRPQEMLTTQVADAMVQQINTVANGPVMGEALQFAVQTGDNADNCQLNEVRWNIDVLDGGSSLVPDSGSLTKWEGVADRKIFDAHYWHPEPGAKQDIYHDTFGFPDVGGLLDAARRPFTPAGLNIPWYAVFGNHDGLVQGNFPKTLPLSAVSMGPLKITTVPPGLSQADILRAVRTVNANPLLGATALNAATAVSSDPKRKILNRKQTVEEHFNTSGTPVGHGYTADNRAHGTAFYYFDQGNVRCVVLDTCNPSGYSEGSIDKPQFEWLKLVLAGTTDKYVIIFSHHTAGTMTNRLRVVGLDLPQRILGPAVVTELHKHPNVVAWVNGHTHRNQIIPQKRFGKPGFWEINTASHVDFPQQARLIEVVDNHDGTLSIFATMLDHAGPASNGGSLSDNVSLAALARELAANDPQERTSGKTGVIADRNVELLVSNALV
jgi:metallophosphoesterase (TIGR03767 family)